MCVRIFFRAGQHLLSNAAPLHFRIDCEHPQVAIITLFLDMDTGNNLWTFKAEEDSRVPLCNFADHLSRVYSISKDKIRLMGPTRRLWRRAISAVDELYDRLGI